MQNTSDELVSNRLGSSWKMGSALALPWECELHGKFGDNQKDFWEERCRQCGFPVNKSSQDDDEDANLLITIFFKDCTTFSASSTNAIISNAIGALERRPLGR